MEGGRWEVGGRGGEGEVARDEVRGGVGQNRILHVCQANGDRRALVFGVRSLQLGIELGALNIYRSF